MWCFYILLISQNIKKPKIMNALIISSFVVALIAAVSMGVVRSGAQYKQALLSMRKVLPDWWPKGWLTAILVLHIVAFLGAAVLVAISLERHIMNGVNIAMIVMFLVCIVFIYMVGSFLGIAFSSGILVKRARKYGGIDLSSF